MGRNIWDFNTTRLSAGSNQFNWILISTDSIGSNQLILLQPPISKSSFTVASTRMPDKNIESLLSTALSKVKYRHPDLTKRDVLSLLRHYRYCFKKVKYRHPDLTRRDVLS